MPVTHAVFHRLAAREYRAARDWYAQRSTEVANRFRDSVDRAVNRITVASAPLPVLKGEYRYARVGRFPYLLVFRHVDARAVVILAVAHTSRRPGYWRRRK